MVYPLHVLACLCVVQGRELLQLQTMADNGGIGGRNSGVDDTKARLEAAMKNLRKVRVFCSDPDATDSSSDEDDNKNRSGPRQIVREIVILVKPDGGDETVKRKGSSVRTPGKKITGVRMRKWGKWAAEIRDPFDRKRIWLGSFNTADEASKAYLAKKEEFRARLEKARQEHQVMAPQETGGEKSRKSSAWVSQKGNCPTDVKDKKLGLSSRSNSGQGPTRNQCKGVRMTKSGRWSSKVYDPSKRKRVWLGTYDSEEEASSAFQSKKLEFGAECVDRPGSGNGPSLKMPKTETLSLLSDVGGDTISGTTIASMEVSGDEGVKTSMAEGQIFADVKTEASNQPWLGLGVGMLKIDNNGNLLGHFSRIDDTLKIC